MRELTRREALAGSAAGLLGLGAGACGPSSRETADGKPILNLWAFDREGRAAWHEQAWQLYKQERNPDFELEILVLPFQQMHDKVLVAAQAGSGGPDIVDIEISAFGRYIKGEPIFLDLTSQLRRTGIVDDLYQASATDPWSYEDRVYGLGSELNTCLMCYRRDIFEEAGIDTPIETWEEFAEHARRYHRDTGRYLMDVEYLDWQEWWQLTLQQGGGFFDEDGNPTLDSPEGIRTLAFRRQAVDDGWALLRSSDTGSPQQFTALGNGQVATILGPAWHFSGNTQNYLPDTEGQWRLQPFPRWENGGSRSATHGGTGVCVMRTCPLPDEAIDFVLWEHSSVEALMLDYQQRQTFPTYQPAYEEPELNEPVPFFDNQQVGQLIDEISSEINTWYNSPFWPETTDATLREGITPSLSTSTPTEEAMRTAQNETLKIIDLAGGS